MADFLLAFDRTMGHEGGYSNVKADRGKETFRGISRVYWPNWSGWSVIDEAKAKGENIDALTLELSGRVKEFYKSQFWNRFRGDDISEQAIAEELFDTAVNMGVHTAVKFLQYGLNKLNRAQRLFFNMAEDGVLGPRSLKHLELILAHGDGTTLCKIMNVEQGHAYNKIMDRSEDQEIFARGWYNRVSFSKNHR